MKIRKLALILSCVATVAACQEETVPVGPITAYEGTAIGLPVEEIVGHAIETEQRELFVGRVLVGVIPDFVPNFWRYSPDGWNASYNATLFYDLNTRLVFRMHVVSNFGADENTCRTFGRSFLDTISGAYEDVRITTPSPAHGAVWIMPAQSQKVDGREQQNFITAGCPVGYRLTPQELTRYEWDFSNGFLRDRVLSGG